MLVLKMAGGVGALGNLKMTKDFAVLFKSIFWMTETYCCHSPMNIVSSYIIACKVLC